MLIKFATKRLFFVFMCFWGVCVSHEDCFTDESRVNDASLESVIVKFCSTFSLNQLSTLFGQTVMSCKRSNICVVGKSCLQILFEFATLKSQTAFLPKYYCLFFFVACSYHFENVLGALLGCGTVSWTGRITRLLSFPFVYTDTKFLTNCNNWVAYTGTNVIWVGIYASLRMTWQHGANKKHAFFYILPLVEHRRMSILLLLLFKAMIVCIECPV